MRVFKNTETERKEVEKLIHRSTNLHNESTLGVYLNSFACPRQRKVGVPEIERKKRGFFFSSLALPPVFGPSCNSSVHLPVRVSRFFSVVSRLSRFKFDCRHFHSFQPLAPLSSATLLSFNGGCITRPGGILQCICTGCF